MTDANFKSTLQMSNGVKSDPITVTPILHLSNGVQFTLAPVPLEPSGTAVVNINQELASQGIASYATLSGYIEIQYQWPWAAVCATVWNVDIVHSLIFTYGLQPPPLAVPPQDSAADAHPLQVLEGMWWKQEINVTGFLALSNITAKAIEVSVQVTDGENNSLGKHDLTITPHGTKTVNLTELLAATSSAGGVLLTQDGPKGGLVVNGGLEDEAVGYSARLPLIAQSPASSGNRTPGAPAATREASYAELGLMTGAADPMMNFPAGTVFMPYTLVRNNSSQPFSLTPTLWWMEAAAARSAQLPQVTVAPHQTRRLDVLAFLSSAGLANFNGSVNLVLDTQGQKGGLLMAGGSVDQKNTYVFEVVPQAILESVAKNLARWSTANGDDTMVTLWNPADEAQDFVFTLFFSGGHYGYPIHLGPRATETFDVSEIIHNQIPDAEGNNIPVSVREGSASVSGARGDNEHILVAMDAGTYNVLKATCGHGCTTCDGVVSSFVNATPFAVAVGASTQEAFIEQYHSGTQYDATSISSWSSSDSSKATANAGLVSGVGAGSFSITAYDGSEEPEYDVICTGGEGVGCPFGYVSPSGSGSGAACDFNITPSQGITAAYCNGTTENQQNFAVSLTSNSPGSCQIVSSTSSCGSTATGNITIDDDVNKTGWNVQNQQCNMFYWASGTSGQDAGNYRTDIQIKFFSSGSPITHTATGSVTCP